MDADINAVLDRGESPGMMEPMVIGRESPAREALTDLAVELAQRSAGFRRALPESLTASLAQLVRAMNCYYSNLIEGHDTHPVDIERALKGDYSSDPKQRNLQLEAAAHIQLQEWIDSGGLDQPATAGESLRRIHRRFCEALPDELLWVEDRKTGERIRVLPGELRARDVAVGRHVAVSPGAVPRFLARFDEAYSSLGKAETILAAAPAHHRLVWIHPFLDGNGRVARLMSHAVLLRALDTGGAWSVARGLARRADAYKDNLAACDQTRRNDLDGRGHLSAESLEAFTRFFLETCLDQVAFMERLVSPARLRERIMLWAEEEVRLGALPPKSTSLLSAVLYRGELPRGETAAAVGTGERQARRVLSALLEAGILVSASARAPVRLAFPAALAPRWMPGLFPDKPGGAA